MKISEIAEYLDAAAEYSGDAEISGAAGMESARQHEISFVERISDESISSRAGCLITPLDFDAAKTHSAVIRVADPKFAFAKIAAVLHPPKKRAAEIHPTAVIAENAKIGRNVYVGALVCVGEKSTIGDGSQLLAGAKIGERVSIGEDCVLHPDAQVADDCQVGNRVILHAGAIIGADGFGYVRNADGYIKFPQIGIVSIEDDVEIGANTCIDRGSLGETRIGRGTKIDNLVQIAHNVRIGERVIIAAQTGISGSTVIEDDCVIGGQVGMGDHARVKSGAIIGSQAGVLPGKIVRAGVWWGTPVQPLDEYKRQNAMVKGLKRLRDDVKELKKKVD